MSTSDQYCCRSCAVKADRTGEEVTGHAASLPESQDVVLRRALQGHVFLATAAFRLAIKGLNQMVYNVQLYFILLACVRGNPLTQYGLTGRRQSPNVVLYIATVGTRRLTAAPTTPRRPSSEVVTWVAVVDP